MPPQHILRQGQTASENLTAPQHLQSEAGRDPQHGAAPPSARRSASPRPSPRPARPAPPPDAEGASGEAAAPPCGGYQQSSPAAREQNGARSRRLQGARRGGKDNCRETDPSLPPTSARRALRAARKPPAAHHRTARRGVSVCRRGLPHPSPAALGAAIFPLPLPPPLPATAPLLPSGQLRASGRAATDLHRRALRWPCSESHLERPNPPPPEPQASASPRQQPGPDHRFQNLPPPSLLSPAQSGPTAAAPPGPAPTELSHAPLLTLRPAKTHSLRGAENSTPLKLSPGPPPTRTMFFMVAVPARRSARPSAMAAAAVT